MGVWLAPLFWGFVEASPMGPCGIMGRDEDGLSGGGCAARGVVDTEVFTVEEEGVPRELGKTRLGIEGGGRSFSV